MSATGKEYDWKRIGKFRPEEPLRTAMDVLESLAESYPPDHKERVILVAARKHRGEAGYRPVRRSGRGEDTVSAHMLTVVAPTDAQLAYIASLCEDRGLEPPQVVARCDDCGRVAVLLGKAVDA